MYDQLSILIVEDDAETHHAVAQAIRANQPGAAIRVVTTVRQAAAIIEAGQHFDCAFVGYNLADGGGLSGLLELREAADALPLIVVTQRGDERLAVDMLRAGAADYLSREELTPSLLAHCMRGALRYQQSQEQIRQAREALQLRDRAIAAASNGIVIADPHQPDCPIIYANPAFTAITGYALDEVLGRNCRFLQGEDTDPQYIQQVRDCMRDEHECQITLRNYKKDGTPFWNELTLSPVRDAEGRVSHFIGVQTDITERRDAEEALRISVTRQQTLLRDMFSSVTDGKLTLCGTADDLPDRLIPFREPVSLSQAGSIRKLREYTLVACRQVGIPDERRYDLETAVGEAAMNAVVHAATGMGHVCLHEQGTVQVWVADEGKGIATKDLPNATLKRGYSSAGTMGHGFKMILKTVDRVHLLTGGTGTTVVMEQDRTPPPGDW